jgi:hypothetical protein
MVLSSKDFCKVQPVEVGGNPRTIYSSNPGVQATIESLLALGCPPIPVAPKQDPRAEGCHHQHFAIVRFKEANRNQPENQGDYCRISQTKIGDSVAPVKGDYCRLDENLQPIGRFTGKNPSYLDRNGRARSLNHRTYQNRLPYEWELREWFSNSETGIGTLGGHSGVVWIDFDAKNYSSQEDCDRDVQRIISANNLEDTWIERTGSGGWRIAVRPQIQPTFTNFSTTIDGVHIGEALGEGRFTVLSPTIHPNGNSYRRIAWSSPAEVESLEAIDIFPTKDEIANQSRKQKRAKASVNLLAPTDPIDNPWDIRNFADRLIGYRIEGDWIECKCPAHNGTSDDSLHIRIDTGAYKCWAGCDAKRIQQEALAIAVASGYELPETESQTKYGQSDRNRLINKRVFRFRQFWEDLQRDFLLPSIVNGNEIRWQVYQGFALPIDLFWDTTFLQGWLGAGKTEAMLRSLIPYQDKTIVWVAPRNGLLRQTAKRAQELGFYVYHYQDDVSLHRQMIRTDQPGIYLMTPDCFKAYAVKNVAWTSKIFVIDEFDGIRKEILGKTTELPHLMNAIAQCGSLLVADAFMSQIDIGVIRKYRLGSIQILSQEFKKSPVKIKWLECRNRKGDISFSHEGVYYPLLDQWIEEKLGRIAIASDSIHIAKMLDRYLKSKGVKTWIVCSETPEQNKNFMTDPDNLIESGKIQAVIYTPTAQSGLDIQAKFDQGLLICTGTLAPTQMLQMLGRCRQCPEWYVSAPRHSGNPECVTPSLDSKKIRGWTEQINQAFGGLGFNAPLEMQGWAFWEDLTCNIEKAFTSEYMRHLLDHFFESVEAVEVESDRVPEWRRDSQVLKNEEFEKTLKANLSNGLRLIDEQKQPNLNSEVWDIKLAEFCGKYPKIAKKAISDFEQSEIQARQSNAEIDRLGGCDAIREKLAELETQLQQMDDEIELLNERLDVQRRIVEEDSSPENLEAIESIREELREQIEEGSLRRAEHEKLDRLLLSAKGELGMDAIDMTRLFNSRRVEKLKNYVSATEPNAQDDHDLLQYLRDRPTHYNAGNFKRLQNTKLFRSLNLGSLASIANIKEVEADVNAFRALSPVIVKLYRQFQANSELIRLFPLIDSEKAFFDHLKACMSYLGYERGGKSIRVETEGLNQNGFDRKGNQRFSKSKTFYFVFWFLIECSGSDYFRENLELILEALRDRLASERNDRQRRRKQKERYETPPPGWEAQAA